MAGTSIILINQARQELISSNASLPEMNVFDGKIFRPKMPRYGEKRLRFVRNLTVDG
jgi:hypothetical protein